MSRLNRVVVLLIPLLACGSQGARTMAPPAEEEPEMESGKKDAGSSGKMDAKPVAVAKDAEPAATPDSAAPPSEDALPSEPDTGAPSPDLGAPSSDASSGPPPTEAKWSHTMCSQGSLMYPNIDKNMGKFPPGSCPPPETLPRPCGGDSKLAVMATTTSGYETGFWHPAMYAVDQYMMTRWSSPGSMAMAWLALDLGAEKTFKRIYLAWELSHASDYDLEVSKDGTTWMPLKQIRGGNGYQDIIDVEGSARHLRITGITKGKTDTGGATYGYSLFDVTVCGERP
jgi:hypothetical protein